MNKQISVRATMVALSSALLFSCQKAETVTPDQDGNVNDFIKSLPSVQQITPFSERLVVGTKANLQLRPAQGGILAVSGGQEYEQAKQFEEQLLFSDDQEIFYPGASVLSISY